MSTPLKINIAPAGTEILKLPFASAAVPVRAPFTFTVAPAIGTPLSSVTVPVTTRFCANDSIPLNISMTNSVKIFLMCDCDWFRC